MAYEQRPNTGSLFKNDRKTQDNHPDYKGGAKLDCPHCRKITDLDMGAWIKELPRGGKVMSISFKQKQDRQQQTGDFTPQRGIDRADVPSSPMPGTPPPDEDDVPFAFPRREFNSMRMA